MNLVAAGIYVPGTVTAGQEQIIPREGSSEREPPFNPNPLEGQTGLYPGQDLTPLEEASVFRRPSIHYLMLAKTCLPKAIQSVRLRRS